MARERRPFEEEDDGRTIADMNVEGMPWYDAEQKKRDRAQARAELKQKIDSGEALNGRQTLRYTLYAVLAGLTVVGVIGGGTVLFVYLLWLFWK